jgi:hypothetical protein
MIKIGLVVMKRKSMIGKRANGSRRSNKEPEKKSPMIKD